MRSLTSKSNERLISTHVIFVIVTENGVQKTSKAIKSWSLQQILYNSMKGLSFPVEMIVLLWRLTPLITPQV